MKNAIFSRRIITTLMLIVLCILPLQVQAKWWIFGQSGNEISTRYIYLNSVAYDELGDKATLYRDTLENGQIVLRGKAATTTSLVSSVQVSIDNKETWTKAKRTSDGTFEYSFRPETGKSYVLYVKIIDTTGKSNDVDTTKKEITISDENISALIRQALDGMINAYREEEASKFMGYVREDFTVDYANLDRAVRKDFNIFDNIDLRYTLTNVTSGANRNIFAAITFNRQVTFAQNGQTLRDSGPTEFVFKLSDNGAKVFSMKNPLIFGISDPEGVATGTSGAGGNFITLGPDGKAAMKPLGDGTGTAPDDGMNLRIVASASKKHSNVVLDWDTPFDLETGMRDYRMEIYEAVSPGGPWETLGDFEFGKPFDLTTRRIASESTVLYYKLQYMKFDRSEISPMSNIVEWDNR